MKAVFSFLLLLLLLGLVSCHKQGKAPKTQQPQSTQPAVTQGTQSEQGTTGCGLKPGSNKCVTNPTKTSCDYDVDAGTGMDVEMTRGDKAQKIHFHGNKNFSVSIMSDPGCPHSGCEACPFGPNNCSSSGKNMFDVTLPAGTSPGYDCQYTLTVQPEGTTGADPVIIIH